MESLKLYMVLVGCRPKGRNTEQHDVFFGIGKTVKDLLPDIFKSWPETENNFHLDAWREVTQVDNYALKIVPATEKGRGGIVNKAALFFLNLGGYKLNEFDEFHYKMLVIADDKILAIKRAKQTAFYLHTGFKTAPAHIDDKYGIDVDDIAEVKEILPPAVKQKYQIKLLPTDEMLEDKLHLGYMPPDKL